MLRGFGLLGVLVDVVVVAAGVVVVFVVGGVTGGTAEPAGLVPAGKTAAPLEVLAPAAPGVPEVGVVAAGVVAGKVVIGVGNGGSGLDSTLAIISFKPVSDWLCRNLYQVLAASSQSFFCA